MESRVSKVLLMYVSSVERPVSFLKNKNGFICIQHTRLALKLWAIT